MARTRAAKKSTVGSKLSDAINAIRSSGFRSTNHFIQKFYDSEHAVQSLRHQEGKSYGPAKLMDLWTQSVPSGSEHELHLAITRKAAQIMVKESTTAYHDKTLRFSSSGLDIPYLTTDFGIKTIQQSYANLLPCLSFLLHALLTAENDYERRNDTEKMGKEKMAGNAWTFWYETRHGSSCRDSKRCPRFFRAFQPVISIHIKAYAGHPGPNAAVYVVRLR